MAPITPPYQPPFRYPLAFGSGAPHFANFFGGGSSALASPPVGGAPRYLGGYFGQGGGQGGGFDQGISQQVQGIIGPQLQAAADAINRRSQIGSQAIGGLTDYLRGLASQYGGAVDAAYTPAVQSTRATSKYARAALTSQGTAKAADLNAATAQAGQQAPADINLAQEGAGAGNAAYGTGIAALDAWIANQAAAQTQAALEPSVASGMGGQNQSILAAQLARQLADQQGQIEGQVPQLLLDLQNQSYQRSQDQAASARDQRNYDEQVRQYNQNRQDQLNAKKSSTVGPKAPTIQGRVAYWQGVADQRNRQGVDPHGYVWKATSTGIRPVTDPKTGKPSVAPWYTAAVQSGAIKQQAAQAKAQTDAQRTRIAQQNANTSSARAATAAAQAQAHEDNRHAEAIGRLKIAGQNAQTATQRAAIERRRAAETARHNRATEQIARAKAAAAAKKKSGSSSTFDPSTGKYG